MCGICGVLEAAKNGESVVNGDLLKRMTAKIAHRGPDDEGFYVDQSVGLGVRRLSIIDLATGHQPIHNEDKTVWTVLNGEIYNFKELRRTLQAQGHEFYTSSDTEVIVHLYEEHSEEFVRSLRGEFALALWDEKRRTLILARDRLGVKPLYYSIDGKRLIFGSEVKSLLASRLIQPEVDLEAFDLFLCVGYVPGRRTMFRGISKLLPAHLMRWEDGQTRIRPYWQFASESVKNKRPASFYAERFLTLFEEAVRLELVSDVSLGVMLSGGIDSSAITALAAQGTFEPLRTFTVGFEGDKERNELEDARLVASHLGTDHYELSSSFDLDIETFARLVWHMDEPIADLSAIGFYYVCQLARQHVTVALAGQGADELLAGYRRYKANRIDGYYRLLPAFVRENLIASAVTRIPRASLLKKAAWTLGESNLAEWYARSLTVFSPQIKSRILHPDLKSDREDGTLLRELISSYLGEFQSTDSLSTLLFLDSRLALPDDLLTYFDKMSMANSLEVRVPFLDYKLVEFCTAMPSDLKLRGFTTKYILRKAACPLLPRRTLKKRKTGFFAHLINDWVRNKMSNHVREMLLDPAAGSRSFLDTRGVQWMLDEHMNGRQDFGRQIYCLFLFEIWHRVFLSNNL